MDSDKPARYIDDVILQMAAVIPPSEAALIDQLTVYRNSLWNVAPELLKTAQYWSRVADILNRYIPEIDEDWKHRLVKIFNNAH